MPTLPLRQLTSLEVTNVVLGSVVGGDDQVLARIGGEAGALELRPSTNQFQTLVLSGVGGEVVGVFLIGLGNYLLEIPILEGHSIWGCRKTPSNSMQLLYAM